MSSNESPAIAYPAIRTIVVPSMIYEACIRANLHLMDLTVFDKLRKIASLEDIAVFAALNDKLHVGGERIASSNLADIVTLGSGNAIEMQAVFDKMAKTKEIENRAMNSIDELADPFSEMLRLKVNPAVTKAVPDKSMKNTLGSPLTPNEDLPYQLKTSGSNVFIVVGNGFNKYIGAPIVKEESKTFVRDFLKLCTGLFSPSEVARHPLFKSFLYSLAN